MSLESLNCEVLIDNKSIIICHVTVSGFLFWVWPEGQRGKVSLYQIPSGSSVVF